MRMEAVGKTIKMDRIGNSKLPPRGTNSCLIVFDTFRLRGNIGGMIEITNYRLPALKRSPEGLGSETWRQ